jgi:hypothetical protein
MIFTAVHFDKRVHFDKPQALTRAGACIPIL